MTPEQQLVEELHERFEPLVGLLPLSNQPIAWSWIEQAAARLSMQLGNPQDAPEAALEILEALDPDEQWWRTPLGMEVARSADVSGRGVTQADAAKILGVTGGTVSQLVHRGTLPHSVDGGVDLAAVLERLVRLERS